MVSDVDVEKVPTFSTIEMAMLPHVRAITRSIPIQIHLPHEPALDEGIKAVVDRRHRDIRHVVLGTNEHLIRSRVVKMLYQNRIHMTTLRREPQPALGKPVVQ